MGFFEVILVRAAPTTEDHSKIHREASTVDDPDIPSLPTADGLVN